MGKKEKLCFEGNTLIDLNLLCGVDGCWWKAADRLNTMVMDHHFHCVVLNIVTLWHCDVVTLWHSVTFYDIVWQSVTLSDMAKTMVMDHLFHCVVLNIVTLWHLLLTHSLSLICRYRAARAGKKIKKATKQKRQQNKKDKKANNKNKHCQRHYGPRCWLLWPEFWFDRFGLFGSIGLVY